MRLFSLCFAGLLMVSGVAAAAAQTTPAASVQQPTNVSPAGSGSVCASVMVRVRVSYIKGGMMPLFEKAAAAQQAYYDKTTGAGKHKILVGKLIETNPLTQGRSISEGQALSYHVYPVDYQGAPPVDDEYKAFVKMFSESSTIKYEYLTCMAKAPLA